MKKENIEMNLTDHTLTIKGRKQEGGRSQKGEPLPGRAFPRQHSPDPGTAEGSAVG
jgi:hypothetical protein